MERLGFNSPFIGSGAQTETGEEEQRGLAELMDLWSAFTREKEKEGQISVSADNDCSKDARGHCITT